MQKLYKCLIYNSNMGKKTEVPDRVILFSFTDPDVLASDQYKQWIAALNKGLSSVQPRYDAIMQYGAKTGETYFQHAVHGVAMLLQLQKIICDGDPQTDPQSLAILQQLCLAYLVHDLNKLPDYAEMPSERLWSRETVLRELDTINVENWIDDGCPDWRSYIPDITVFIQGHSIIYNHRGQALFSSGPTAPPALAGKCTPREISFGVDAMQLVDIADLLRDLSAGSIVVSCRDEHGDTYHTSIDQTVLLQRIEDRLSRLQGEPIRITPIKVTMNASKFTNIMLNSLIEHLDDRYAVMPLVIFPSGMYVFGHESMITRINTPSDQSAIIQTCAEAFVAKIDTQLMSEDKLGDLYDQTGQGVKIADYIYQHPNAPQKMRKILTYLTEHLPPLSIARAKDGLIKKDKLHDSARYKNVVKIADYVPSEIMAHPCIAKWEMGENVALLENDALWRIGRVLHTIYVALTKLYARASITVLPESVMHDVIVAAGIEEQMQDVYNQGTKKGNGNWYVYDAISFLLGDAVLTSGQTLETIAPRLIDLVCDKMASLSKNEYCIPNPEGLLNRFITIGKMGTTSSTICHAHNPIDTIICAVCGQRMPVEKTKKATEDAYGWKAQFVTDGVTVRKFSNMLPGGDLGQPVRTVCNACKWRYYFEAMLNQITGKGLDTTYITFYYPHGIAWELIKAFQANIMRIKKLPEQKAFQIRLDHYAEYSIQPNKGYGLVLPTINDEMAGSIPFQWTMSAQPVANGLWSVLLNALAFAIPHHLKVVISKLRNDYEDVACDADVLIQDIPVEFRSLIPRTHLTFDDAQRVLSQMIRIDALIKQLISVSKGGLKIDDVGKHCIDTLRSLKLGELATIHFFKTLCTKANITNILTIKHQVEDIITS